jgi:hypothetical protein
MGDVHLPTVLLQWSRLGRPVYLVDQNEKQLSRAWDDIQTLRRKNLDIARKVDRWGSIITSPSAKGLEPAVANSWLMMEVRFPLRVSLQCTFKLTGVRLVRAGIIAAQA